MKLSKIYVMRLTGKQVTMIVAALVKSRLPGSRILAVKLLEKLSEKDITTQTGASVPNLASYKKKETDNET